SYAYAQHIFSSPDKIKRAETRVYSQVCQGKAVSEAQTRCWFDLLRKYINNDLIDNEKLRVK
ncbi:hypothetical protein CWN50_33550, partial [Klebsiella michiganensis]